MCWSTVVSLKSSGSNLVFASSSLVNCGVNEEKERFLISDTDRLNYQSLFLICPSVPRQSLRRVEKEDQPLTRLTLQHDEQRFSTFKPINFTSIFICPSFTYINYTVLSNLVGLFEESPWTSFTWF